jgi:hypothetical protein
VQSTAYANALCESFFATLECELLWRTRFRSQAEARMAIFEFIEGWYNPHRRHSALAYDSPYQYEQRHQAVSATALRPETVAALPPGSPIGEGGAISLSPVPHPVPWTLSGPEEAPFRGVPR